MIKQYRFGHTDVEIAFPEGISIPQNWKLFEGDFPEAAKRYELKLTDELDLIEGQFQILFPEAQMITRKDMTLLIAPGKECRILRFAEEKEPYAVTIEESPRFTRVWIHTRVKALLQYDAIFGSLLSLEKVMIREKALILHSAYMCRNGKAVLFSAPSETGKSTQAGLWEKYRGTRTINGDRSLLIREENGWFAYGWPICGSSKICHNEAYPIQAIVMLYQAKENAIKKLSMAESMKKIMTQITINMWNTEFQIQAMDLIWQLVTEIPVYELGCNISEEAVICLESVL